MLKRLSFALIVIVSMILPLFISGGTASANSWYSDLGMKYRKTITIDHTKLSGDLTNYVMLIKLASDTGLAARAQDDGDDIMFTDSSQNKLYHEEITFNGTTGALIAWVKVPSISSSTNTVIYMYYGNASASNQEDVANTWSGYSAVWHMADTTTSTINATKSSINLTKKGANEPIQAAGQIYYSQDFDEVDDYASNTGNTSGIDASTKLTMELLLNPDDDSDALNFLLCNRDDTQYYSIYIDNAFKVGGLVYTSSAQQYITSTHAVSQGAWSHVLVTYNESNTSAEGHIYINGSLDGTKDSAGTLSITTGSLYFGEFPAGGDYYYDGRIEEIRIVSGSALSADYALASSNNQLSPSTFYSLGTESVFLTSSSGANGNTSTPGEGTYVYDINQVVNIVGTADTCYTFLNWTGTGVTAGKVASNTSASTAITMNGSYTLISNYTATTYTLTTASGSGGNVTTPGESAYTKNCSEVVTLAATANAHYHFVNWTGDTATMNSTTSSSATITMNGNCSITANFTIDTYTLTYTAGSGGSINGTSPQTVNYGGSGTAVTANPNACYHFVNWSDASTANPRTDSPVTADVTVTANFAKTTYYLNISAGLGGNLSTPTSGVHSYDCGDVVHIIAVADDDYDFSKWTGDTATIAYPYAASTTITMNGNYTIAANFDLDIYSSALNTLTVSSDTDDGELYYSGTTYASVRNSSSGYVNDLDIIGRIGQSNTSGVYSIYRTVLIFDTSNLPDNADVTSATLYFYGKSDSSTTNFNISAIACDNIGSPMIAADYYSAHEKTASIGTKDTASFSVGGYNSITLSNASLTEISKIGDTNILLRSDRDVAGTTPTGDEYVTIYTGEMGTGYYPYIVIEYSQGGKLAAPDFMTIYGVRVFNNYDDARDKLFCILYNVEYTAGPPAQNPGEYINIQLVDGSNVVGQSKLPTWGMAPGSIYVSSNMSIEWGSDYQIVLIGSDKYDDYVYWTYELQDSDWSGYANTILLDNWVMASANSISDYYEVATTEYFQGEWVLNSYGGVLFRDGIPGLDFIRPNLFKEKTVDPSQYGTNTDPDYSYQNTLNGSDSLGVITMNALNDLGETSGVGGTFFAGFFWFFLMMIICGSVLYFTNNALLGLILSVPFLIVGGLFGIVPLVVIAVLGLICAAAIMYTVWGKIA